MRMKLRTWNASAFIHWVCLLWLADTWLPSWECSYTVVQELNRLIPNFQKKIDKGSPEELNTFYAEVSNIALYISVFACWVNTSFSAVLTAPVATTWIGFVDPLQIGWMWPYPTPLSCWTTTATAIGELLMMLQDDSYVLQSLIGTTLCE